jgi:hypothetical protein
MRKVETGFCCVVAKSITLHYFQHKVKYLLTLHECSILRPMEEVLNRCLNSVPFLYKMEKSGNKANFNFLVICFPRLLRLKTAKFHHFSTDSVELTPIHYQRRLLNCRRHKRKIRYKPAGRGFDSRWCHGNFSVT